MSTRENVKGIGKDSYLMKNEEKFGEKKEQSIFAFMEDVKKK